MFSYLLDNHKQYLMKWLCCLLYDDLRILSCMLLISDAAQHSIQAVFKLLSRKLATSESILCADYLYKEYIYPYISIPKYKLLLHAVIICLNDMNINFMYLTKLNYYHRKLRRFQAVSYCAVE